MAHWHRLYNVSGTVHCADRLDSWCEILRDALQLEYVSYISHMTGAVSIIAYSPIADVASSGHDVHNVFALVHGDRSQWLRFVVSLQSALGGVNVQYSLIMHDSVKSLP
jgi:hypothetical protein